jgi:hypothetical protein
LVGSVTLVFGTTTLRSTRALGRTFFGFGRALGRGFAGEEGLVRATGGVRTG